MALHAPRCSNAWTRNNSLVCVGLDPEPAKFPCASTRQHPDAVFEFCRAIVDATADLVCRVQTADCPLCGPTR